MFTESTKEIAKSLAQKVLWDKAGEENGPEIRDGSKGQFCTTGAKNGFYEDGGYRYQVSFSVNRFPIKAKTAGLTERQAEKYLSQIRRDPKAAEALTPEVREALKARAQKAVDAL